VTAGTQGGGVWIWGSPNGSITIPAEGDLRYSADGLTCRLRHGGRRGSARHRASTRCSARALHDHRAALLRQRLAQVELLDNGLDGDLAAGDGRLHVSALANLAPRGRLTLDRVFTLVFSLDGVTTFGRRRRQRRRLGARRLARERDLGRRDHHHRPPTYYSELVIGPSDELLGNANVSWILFNSRRRSPAACRAA